MHVNVFVLILEAGVPRINRRPADEPVYDRKSVDTAIGRADIDVPVDYQLTVACSATGDPQPIISWFDNSNSAIGNTGRIQVTADGSLRISNFESGDAGFYYCRALNSKGTDQEIIQVRQAGRKY